MNRCGTTGFNICKVAEEDLKWIKKLDAEAPIKSVYSGLEEDLRRWLASQKNMSILGKEYKEYELYVDDYGHDGELYSAGEAGQIDLLCKNDKGDFLVVELKSEGESSDSVVGQTARYVGWVKERLAKGRNVSGLIVVQSSTPRLRYAIGALEDCGIRLLTFELSFKFSPIDTTLP